MNQESQSQVIGCILGTAIGDAIGLPYENLSPRRAAKLLGPPDRQRFLFHRGMVSDDTEHTCMVAQSMIASGDDPESFRRSLAWRLRWWLLGLPAGAGMATMRSCAKLWLGCSPRKSGVFSAGNGPAMRAAILGVAIHDRNRLREYVRISSQITHSDPKAEFAALAIALAANMASRREELTGDQYLGELQSLLDGKGDELFSLMTAVVSSVAASNSTQAFARSQGLDQGVTGYAYHSVPIAIHAWLAHPCDFRTAIIEVVECGGDADTTAAMVGGILGAAVGREGIPSDWLDNLYEWPRTIGWMDRLGLQLTNSIQSRNRSRAASLPPWGLFPRNLFFLAVVLYHGFRRLLPPY